MIYFDTIKLDNQSRLYIDSRIREVLKLDRSKELNITCVGNAVILTPCDENTSDLKSLVDIQIALKQLNTFVSK